MSYRAPKTWAEVAGAVRTALAEPFTKVADENGVPGLSHLADVLGWRAGPLNEWRGGPRPLANLIIGAGLGSLGGYGLGRLAEQILPERYFEPGGMRRRGALLGGVLGALPAGWQAYDNVRQTGSPAAPFDRWPIEHPGAVAGTKAAAEKGAAALFDPMIDRDQFNRAVMDFEGTPLRLRAATTGLVEAASAVADSPIVTPWDVAKIAVGAGTGLISGVIAGKALGFLAGLTPEAREGVQRVGLWSGVLNAVVPKALGLR